MNNVLYLRCHRRHFLTDGLIGWLFIYGFVGAFFLQAGALKVIFDSTPMSAGGQR